MSVDLMAVARRMYARTGKTASELDAMLHLSGSHNGEASPLRATCRLGTYYTEIEPTLLLEPDEVIAIEQTDKTKLPQNIGADD